MPTPAFETLRTTDLTPTPTSNHLAELHAIGEDEANRKHNFEQAANIFNLGIQAYLVLEPEDQVPAASLAYARIQRDAAFLQKNRGVGGDASDLTTNVLNNLESSRSVTEGLLGLSAGGGVSEFGIIAGWRQRLQQSRQGQKAMSLRQLRRRIKHNPDALRLVAEHGATIGGIARLVTRQEAELDTLHENKKLSAVARQQVTGEQKDYGREQAHGFTRLGNNAYYLTSNAMNGARAEVAKGGIVSRLKAAKWVGRAAMGIGRSVVSDRSNFMPSLKTFGRLSFDLYSRKAAIRGIRSHF